MTTLSPTKARANLTSWLKAAAEGEDVGILYGDRVIALRPVEVESTDYALREYGATPSEVAVATESARREITRERRTGKLKKFRGNLTELLEH